MTVWDIVNQFTHLDFTLIVLDVATDYEYYNGPASEVDDDAVGGVPVVAMEPPLKVGEVILYIDLDAYADVEYAELSIDS